MPRILDTINPEETPVDPNYKRKAFIAIVVDESGSMATGREATIRGVNEQIQMIKNTFKDSKDVEPIVSVIKFNEKVNPLFTNKTLNELVEFTNETYIPNGGTAMYDAVGYALNILENANGINEEDSTVLVVVVSDGEENSSKEHNSVSIAPRVKTFNDTKRWTFTYLGANQDLAVVQQHTNIYAGNTASFNASSNIGYASAFSLHSASMGNYLNAISGANYRAVSSTQSFYSIPESDKTESKL